MEKLSYCLARASSVSGAPPGVSTPATPFHTYGLLSKEPGSPGSLPTQLGKPVRFGARETITIGVKMAQRVSPAIQRRAVSILIDEILIQENEFLIFKVAGISKQAVGGVLGSCPQHLSTPPTWMADVS